MAMSVEEFVSRLKRSELLSDSDLQPFLDGDANQSTAETLAKALVRADKLTAYQAQAIYRGREAELVMGNYVLLDKLGQGGMGMVFKARHRRMHRLVAIKVLSPSLVKKPELLERFHREVRAAARLSHPHVVTAHDADEVRGTHFLVLEFVDGTDLSSLVKKQGPLPVSQAVDCVTQAARGLQYAHEQGVIHRDIKPANLLLDKHGTVKILDLGLARIESGDVPSSDLTNTGAVMGTIDYMAPEQALNTKHADARSDIYSLGLTLWYLLTGRSAYSGETLMERLLAHREAPIPSLTDACPDTPPELEAVFRTMVAKAPADRYQSVAEAVAALQSVTAGQTSSPRILSGASEINPLDSFLTGLGVGGSAISTTSKTHTQSRPAAVSSEATMTSGEVSQGTSPALRTLPHGKITRTGRNNYSRLLIPGGGVVAAILLGVWLLRPQATDPPARSSATVSQTSEQVEAASRPVVSEDAPRPAVRTLRDRLRDRPPLLVNHGQPPNHKAYVSRPPALPGLRSWTIETAGRQVSFVHGLVTHPSGDWFASTDSTGALRVWDSNGQLQNIVLGQNRSYTQNLVLLDEGRLLVTASFRDDETIRIWDTATWTCLRAIPCAHGGDFALQGISWSPVTEQLAVAISQRVMLIDPVSGNVQSRGISETFRCVDFSPDGHHLVAGAEGGKLYWLDAATLTPLHVSQLEQLPENRDNAASSITIHDVEFSPDGKSLGVAVRDGSFRVWNTDMTELKERFARKVADVVNELHWFRDNRRLAVAAEGDPAASVWDLDVPDRPLVRTNGGATLFTLAVTPDEREIVFVDTAQQAQSLSLETGEVRSLPNHSRGLFTNFVVTQLSPRGDRLAEQLQNTLTVRDAATGVPLRQHAKVPLANHLIWSPDGQQIALAHSFLENRPLCVLDAMSGKYREFARSDGRIQSMAWSPEGTLLASAGSRREIVISSRESGEVIRSLGSNSLNVSSLAWSPDGKRLAGIDKQGNVGIWNPLTGEKEPVQCPRKVYVIPDAQLLA